MSTAKDALEKWIEIEIPRMRIKLTESILKEYWIKITDQILDQNSDQNLGSKFGAEKDDK